MSRLRATLICAVLASSLPAQAHGTECRDEEVGTTALNADQALEHGDFARALSLSECALRAFSAPTLRLLQGRAEEGLGRLADARASYLATSSWPVQGSEPAAFTRAREQARARLAAIEPRVPRLTVHILAPPTFQGAQVLVDGQSVVPETLLWVNPGTRKVEVKTTDHPAVAPQEVALEPSSARTLTFDLRPGEASGGRRGSLIPAAVAFAGAGGFAIAGAVLAGISFDQHTEVDDACEDLPTCPARYKDTFDSARLFANVSVAMFVIAGAAAVTGVVLAIVPIGGSGSKGVSVEIYPAGVALTDRF